VRSPQPRGRSAGNIALTRARHHRRMGRTSALSPNRLPNIQGLQKPSLAVVDEAIRIMEVERVQIRELALRRPDPWMDISLGVVARSRHRAVSPGEVRRRFTEPFDDGFGPEPPVGSGALTAASKNSCGNQGTIYDDNRDHECQGCWGFQRAGTGGVKHVGSDVARR
jgi:hypothetical protein